MLSDRKRCVIAQLRDYLMSKKKPKKDNPTPTTDARSGDDILTGWSDYYEYDTVSKRNESVSGK